MPDSGSAIASWVKAVADLFGGLGQRELVRPALAVRSPPYRGSASATEAPIDVPAPLGLETQEVNQMDRHRLWRNVTQHHELLQAKAPEGHEAVVEVFVLGREEPIVPAYVETSRSPEYPWAVLQARSARDESANTREPDEFWVHVHADLIQRVEIRFVRTGETPIGFSIGELNERSMEDATAQVPG
jgi:hypothetical protein